MTTASASLPSRGMLVKRSLDLLVVLGLIAGIVLGWGQVRERQRQLTQQQLRLDVAPQAQVAAVQLEQSLERYRHDLDRIYALLLPVEAAGNFVGFIEQTATANKVTVRVPQINEVVTYDANRQPVPPTGPTQEARLSVVATGTPAQLLQFLYALEHAPYLVRATQWEVVTGTTAAEQLTTLAPPAGVETPPAAAQATLEATLIITLRRQL